MNQAQKIEHIQIHRNLEIFKEDLEFALTMKPKMTTITVFVTLYRLQDNLDQKGHQMVLVSDLKLITWRFVELMVLLGQTEHSMMISLKNIAQKPLQLIPM